MTTTLDALLSRDIPIVIAENLIAKNETMASLSQKTNAELIGLGLSSKHIIAIRDSSRPAIPAAVLRKVLDDSWRTCCVCHKPGTSIVVHHITEWGKGGTHAEDNLAVLCLTHHDEAHLTGGLSLRLTQNALREAKKKWVSRAKGIRETYEKNQLSPYHRSVRWYWIHVGNLRASITTASDLGVSLSNEHLSILRERSFIDDKGNINPESVWKETLAKPQKSYLFDSDKAQLMAIYVSDLLGRFIENSAVFDVTEMIDDKSALSSYLSVGSLVYFRHQLEIVDKAPRCVNASINKTDVRIELQFDPWTSLNQTAHGIHVVTDMAERSVVGTISSIGLVGNQLRIRVSPLGISPDFVLHDPAQGTWVKGRNNADYRARRKKAKD